MTHLLIVLLIQKSLLMLNAGEISWSYNYEQSAKNSEVSGKTMIIYFGANWCGPCRRIEYDIFTKPKFIEFSKKFEMVKIYDDFKKGEADKHNYYEMIKKKFNVKYLPTIIIIKKNNAPCTVSDEYRTPEKLINLIYKCH